MAKGPVDPRLLRRSRPTRRFVGALIVLGLAQAVVLIGQAWLLAVSVSGMVAGRPWPEFVPQLAGVAAGFAVRAALSAGQQWAGQRAAAAVKSRLRADLLRARLDRPFAADTSGGRLVTLVTEGVEALDGWYSGYLPQLVLAAIVPLTLLVAIATADPTSAVIIAVTLPLIPIFMVLIGLATRDRMDARWRSNARLGHHFADLLAGLPTLQVFGRARSQLAGLRRVEERHRGATLQVLRVAFLSALVLEVLATLSVALVAVSIGLRVVTGEFTLLLGLFALVLAPEVYLPLRQVGARYHDAADGMAAAEEAFALIDAESRAPGGTRVDLREAAIEFDEVALAPAAAAPAAQRELSFVIGPGEVVAVAGPSGAGKTTLLRALLGHGNVVAGRVLIGGVPIADLDREHLLGQVAWVEQDPRLLPGTIAENVALGAPGAPPGRVIAALRRAGADALAPERELGVDGGGLSAGEVRRIALARALLRIECGGAQVLLLDEPTAGLDRATEARVVRGLADLGVTVIVISHRTAALDLAGQVISLPPSPVATTPPLEDPAGEADPRDDDARAAEPRTAPVPSGGDGLVSRLWVRGGWRRRALWSGTLLLGAAAAGCAVALLGTSGWLLAKASEQPPVLHLMVAVVAVRFFGLGRGVFRYAERLSGHDLGLRDQSALRLRTFAALADSPAAARRHGELVDRLVGDVAAAQDLVLRARLPLLAHAVVSVAVVAFLARWSLPVAALFAGYAVLAGWIWPRVGALISTRADRRLGTLRGALAEQAFLIHRHAPLLHTHGAGARQLARLADADAALVAGERRAATARALAAAGQLLVLAAAWPLMIIAAQQAAASGAWTTIMIATVALLPLALHELYAQHTAAMQAGIRSTAAIARVEQTIEQAAELPYPPPPEPLGEPGIAADQLVLQRGSLPPVDLRVRPGDRMVIAGPSGVGKSTLLATLLGQLPVGSGRIATGGLVGCLGQDAHIFDTTVAENVRLGDPGADEVAVHAALVAAGLPGLPPDRRVGEHGSSVSGGEGRRLALARVLAQRPDVLLLDEPTEHLDSPTARALLADIDAALPDAAILVVSHQPDLIRDTWGPRTRVADVTGGPVGIKCQPTDFQSAKESHDQEGTR